MRSVSVNVYQADLDISFLYSHLPDLSFLGWDAKPESSSAVTQMFQRHFSPDTHPDVRNERVHEIISYLENNPLKFCALVVDAEKIKLARDLEQGVDCQRLLHTAERNVGKIS